MNIAYYDYWWNKKILPEEKSGFFNADLYILILKAKLKKDALKN